MDYSLLLGIEKVERHHLVTERNSEVALRDQMANFGDIFDSVRFSRHVCLSDEKQ